jgi:5-formyltetrahydrofolate cyclo-ligase
MGSILLSPSLACAKDKKKDVTVAPLPAVIVNAKKVFLSNGGGSNLAYDAFYSKMKEWSKYKIVGSPEESDLIVELSYRAEDSTRVWNSTNTYYITTQDYSKQIIDPHLILTVFDAKMKNSLWSETDHRGFAKREKNRETEVNSAQHLVDELKTRVNVPH